MLLGNFFLDFPLRLQNKYRFYIGASILQFQETYCYLEAKDLKLLSPETECEGFFSVLMQLTVFTFHG